MATCPGPDCPMCNGTACAACDSSGRSRYYSPDERCTHDPVERHKAMIAIPDDVELPRQDRTPTKPQPRLLTPRQVCIGIADVAGAVSILKLAIAIIEEHGEVCVTLEPPRTS
jgi:hypothetical protein